MKRGLWTLLVMALVLCVSGMAFAAETPNFTPEPPVQADIEAQLDGAEDVSFVDAGADRSQLNGNQNAALNAILREDSQPTIAKVSFSFPASGTVTFSWKEGQLLFSYTANAFHSYAQRDGASAVAGTVSAMASGTYTMNKNSPYIDPASPAGKGTYVSVEGADTGSGGGGGCSMLTLGAVALFLLPALALTKRKK